MRVAWKAIRSAPTFEIYINISAAQTIFYPEFFPLSFQQIYAVNYSIQKIYIPKTSLNNNLLKQHRNLVRFLTTEKWRYVFQSTKKKRLMILKNFRPITLQSEPQKMPYRMQCTSFLKKKLHWKNYSKRNYSTIVWHIWTRTRLT